MITPVMLARGSGSRLWPLSRAQHPKPFPPPVTDEPFLFVTGRRVRPGPLDALPFIITNEQNGVGAASPSKHGNIEPQGRSTAPAATMAVHLAIEKSGLNAIVLIMPSDPYVKHPSAFLEAAGAGLQAARDGMLVAFGVKPSRPEAGYGSVKTRSCGANGSLAVERFVEKPDGETAARFCAGLGYFWNAGTFLLGAKIYLDELSRFEPDMAGESFGAVKNATSGLNFIRLAESFHQCRSDSIDYAVMEKTNTGALVPLEARWSDMGIWAALFDAGNIDKLDNATRGDVLLRNARACDVLAENGTVVVADVEDIVAVSAKDANWVLFIAWSRFIKHRVASVVSGRKR